MKPKLPRELLWTDKTSMDEFFELDPVNEYFFEYYTSLQGELFGVTLDAVKVFNEVYYQLTRAAYEKPFAFYIGSYIQDIKANLGWSYSAEIVLSMVYWVSETSTPLLSKSTIGLKNFIKSQFKASVYWQPFRKCCQKILKDKLHLRYDFKPNPVSPAYLRDKYLYWSDITYGYDLTTIRATLNLWDDEEDKREVAAMIKSSLGKGSVIKRYGANDKDVVDLLDSYIGENSCFICAEPSPYEDNQKLEERIKQLESENQAKQSRIDELEADNDRLNALLEKKKRNGKARKFTLVQIVDYCKGCVEWDDVKFIVAMLNKLLRRIGTNEDSELVDSIEDEFKNRKYGDAIGGNKNNFGDNSNMVNFVLPENVDYDKLFDALPEEIKDMWKKQLTQKDNG